MAEITGCPKDLLISSREEDSALVVGVEDCGLGLDAEAAEKIFEPFFTTKPHGVGLACPSAGRSLNRMKGDCGLSHVLPGAPFSGSRCPSAHETPMADLNSTIFVVDDDASVREAVSNLLESVGFHTQVSRSTEEFKRAARPEVPSCLVLDVRLPGVGGLEFQAELSKAGISIPIIFVTAHGDVPMVSRAMKGGAIEFLMKPFQKEDLLAAIHQGLERDRRRREEQGELSALQFRFEELTSREREVLQLVVAGLTNKEVAARLGISEVTIKMHRGQVMRKMRAASLADLVRMSDRLIPRARQ
jgi:RNA polymerase sigma factor (sigma-70 family)